MKQKLIVESLDDYFATKLTNMKKSIYDKIKLIYKVIKNTHKEGKTYDPFYTNGAQQEFFKLLDFVGLNNKISEKDIANLDNDRLLILNNGLHYIIEDFDLNIYGVN
jgi:hypothetical protein